MKERGIPFTAEMVLAIARGDKTQTRRRIREREFQRSDTPGYDWTFRDRRSLWNDVTHSRMLERCPYGRPGDILWVRERIIHTANFTVPTHGGAWFDDRDEAAYAADGEPTPLDHWPWKRDHLPSIHMPRGLARYMLQVVRVDIERPCDITEADARAEGVTPVKYDPEGDCWTACEDARTAPHRVALEMLWGDLHGWENMPASWERPCWVIEFRRLNPDHLPTTAERPRATD